MSLMSSLSQLNCPGSRFNLALLARAPAWPRDQEISVRAEEMLRRCDVIDQDDAGLDSLEN